jgi:hypothetical protein
MWVLCETRTEEYEDFFKILYRDYLIVWWHGQFNLFYCCFPLIILFLLCLKIQYFLHIFQVIFSSLSLIYYFPENSQFLVLALLTNGDGESRSQDREEEERREALALARFAKKTLVASCFFLMGFSSFPKKQSRKKNLLKTKRIQKKKTRRSPTPILCPIQHPNPKSLKKLSRMARPDNIMIMIMIQMIILI